LHGKVILFGSHIYVGSANISRNSREHLDEIGIITDHPSVIWEARQFIDDLARKSIKIDNDFIKMIVNIAVKRRDRSTIVETKNIKIRKSRTWLLSIRNDSNFPGDMDKDEEINRSLDKAKDEAPDWFLVRNGRVFREERIGDSVILIRREKLHSERQVVSGHCLIKNITIGDGVKAYHYYYNYDKLDIGWREFTNIARNSGISRLGSGKSTERELTEKQSNVLFEAWGAREQIK
jgi:hypothetical protein